LRFPVPTRTLETIASIQKEHGIGETDSPCLKLPRSAWGEPLLSSECPKCSGRIRYNPFAVDSIGARERCGSRRISHDMEIDYPEIGYHFINSGDHDLAIACFDKALEKNDLDYDALNGKGVCMFYAERYEDAFRYFGDALNHFPRSPILWYNAAMAYKNKKDIEAAAKCFDKCLEYQPLFTEAEKWKSRLAEDGAWAI
jgi:tetratricopeptide (TPR) repeat protein